MQARLKCVSGTRMQHARLGSRRMQSVPDSAAAQQTDARSDQAVFIQRLRQEAFEAGYKAGYQKGVQVQVNVSVDLQDEAGSYLRRRGRDGSSSSSSGADRKQPPGVPARQSLSAAATPTASIDSSSQEGTPAAAASTAGDSIARSAVKGLVWRVFSTSATVTVALVLFQDSLQVSDALKFGGIEFATKYVMYFLHERLWAAVALL